ncbi:Eco57I restriction-modification methylase domain-containing protein [Acinetobacter sp. ANC 5502]
MSTGLELAENFRERISSESSKQHKESLGQYLTPVALAKFAASFFYKNDNSSIRLLDPGAGVGALSCAFINHFIESDIEVTAIEVDNTIINFLKESLENTYINKVNIINGDFINFGISSILDDVKFTHIFLNPPYKKINKKFFSKFPEGVVFNSYNLYSIFLDLAIDLLKENGEIVAIIPRSFCNGRLFSRFRKKLLTNCSIEKIHLFLERDNVFKDDKVLQENIVIHLVKKKQNENVVISYCQDLRFNNFSKYVIGFEKLVYKNDENHIIHIPLGDNKPDIFNFKSNYGELNLSISTGPIVDFRVSDSLSLNMRDNYIPLIYPNNLKNFNLVWMEENVKERVYFNKMKAPNHLFGNGYYVAVRRFSSKEQNRRVYAYLVNTYNIPNIEGVTFENHLNVYHFQKTSLNFDVAKGLVIYLSSKIVDDYIRQFSGSTQININDLKYIPYPTLDQLSELGKFWDGISNLDQEIIDSTLNKFIEIEV